jgi:hypothetical protein
MKFTSVLTAASFLTLAACGGSTTPESTAATAPPAVSTTPSARMPKASAVFAAHPSDSTFRVVQGTLAADSDAEFIVDGEKQSLLLAHVVAADGSEPAVSVHRADTGTSVEDDQANPSLWVGRLPDTLGYVAVVHRTGKETPFTFELESPRELRWVASTKSVEVTSDLAANAVAAYTVPASGSLSVELLRAGKEAYVTIYGLQGEPVLSADAAKTKFDGAVPGEGVVVRVNQGTQAGPFTLRVRQK